MGILFNSSEKHVVLKLFENYQEMATWEVSEWLTPQDITRLSSLDSKMRNRIFPKKEKLHGHLTNSMKIQGYNTKLVKHMEAKQNIDCDSFLQAVHKQ